MPDPVSIKERIERQCVVLAEAIDGIGAVQRWDARGNATTHLACIIVAGDAQVEEGGQGGGMGGCTDVVLPLQFQVCMAQPPAGANAQDSEVNTSALQNTWLAKLDAAVHANETLVEAGTDVRLAVDTRTTRQLAPPVDEGQGEAWAILEVEIRFTHYRSTPYAGPGITAVEE